MLAFDIEGRCARFLRPEFSLTAMCLCNCSVTSATPTAVSSDADGATKEDTKGKSSIRQLIDAQGEEQRREELRWGDAVKLTHARRWGGRTMNCKMIRVGMQFESDAQLGEVVKKLSDSTPINRGGGSGIGRAICSRFAEHGAKLLVVDQNGKSAEDVCASLKSLDGAKHLSFACDVSNSNEVKSLVDFALKHYNSAPNVVVNSAGIIRDSILLKMSEKQFDDVIAVNLKGTYLITQAFTQLAVERQEFQSVINLSSIIGKIGNIGQINYAATKAGVIGLTKTAARELAINGIRLNAILPGFIKTPMTAAIPEKVLSPLCAQIPMGRMGKPEEIADAALFLASDLSTYVTGAAIEVTGGFGM
uniref:(3R)-3-hydroxyacyl-CoA dehydrogenase n=1 Tax=Ascaris lumbricoides TaxID=6252 RepID=A0A9J2PQD1_ASCLU